MAVIEEMVNRRRYFRCWYDDLEFGRFAGKTPKQAAQKAFTQIIRRNKIQDNEFIRFSIIETTRDSNKRSFTYNGIHKN